MKNARDVKYLCEWLSPCGLTLNDGGSSVFPDVTALFFHPASILPILIKNQSQLLNREPLLGIYVCIHIHISPGRFSPETAISLPPAPGARDLVSYPVFQQLVIESPQNPSIFISLVLCLCARVCVKIRNN
jgi:hypothetical protein